MSFPPDTQEGDLFWMNEEPVRIGAWNYTYGPHWERYFDIDFLCIMKDSKPAASMVLIPIGYEFYGVDIRRMSSLEKELF